MCRGCGSPHASHDVVDGSLALRISLAVIVSVSNLVPDLEE